MEVNKKSLNQSYAKSFNSDVVRWRQTAAKLWSILLIFMLILVHSVTSNSNPITNFYGFILNFLLNLISIRFWFYSGLIVAIFWGLFSFNDNLFRVTPKVYSNNLEKFLQNVYSIHSVCIASNLVATILSAYLLLKFYDPEIKIQYLYVCGFCAISNLILKFQFSFNESYLLTWPIISQTKYFRFKSKVYLLALDQFKSVLLHMLIYKVIYFFIGSCIFQSGSSSSFQTTFISLKLAFLLNLAHTISWMIYEIYLTEIYHFNIQSNVNMPFCLPASMSLNTQAYIQTLAFIDFAHISIHSKPKRKQIFSLSYTSSQPVNWSKVSTEALNLTKRFVEIFNFDDMLHGKATSTTHLESPISNQSDSRFSAGYQKAYALRRTINTTSPVDIYGDCNLLKSPLKKSDLQSQKTDNSFLNTISQKLMAFLKSKRVFSHFYQENLNYKTEQLFVDSFLVINALKGLSNLAVSSFTEDEYGIVQQTLPDMINTFMELQKVLERFNPTNSSTSVNFKVLQRPDAGRIELLMQKLTFILNESMFKITQTFGTSLKSLPLSEEAMHRMKRFYL